MKDRVLVQASDESDDAFRFRVLRHYVVHGEATVKVSAAEADLLTSRRLNVAVTARLPGSAPNNPSTGAAGDEGDSAE